MDEATVPSRDRPSAVPGSRRVRFGSFEADLLAGEIRKNGIRIHLHHQPFEVLATLLEHPGEVVTRERLQQKLWPEDTFVDFEHGLNKAINKVREALGDSADNPRFIETLPRRGYRFVAPVSGIPATTEVVETGVGPGSVADLQPVAIQRSSARIYRYVWLAVIGAVALVALWVFVARRLAPSSHDSPVLTHKHTVVLADFANSTGDPVFDETLRQGLTVQLEQSPDVSLISEARMRQGLKLMGQSPDMPADPETAYQICQRTQSSVVVDGSIAALGTQYVLGLKAVDCRTGEPIAVAQERAEGKHQVLSALDKAAVKLRQRLGEPHHSLQQFATPLAEATTPSLEALQAYSLGRQKAIANEVPAAIPLLGRAIELDPKFALAYVGLGLAYASSSQPTLAADYVRKGYELRTEVSELERWSIEAEYFTRVTRNMEKAREVYEVWIQTYPNSPEPYINVCAIYNVLGQPEKTIAHAQEAIRLDPSNVAGYGHLMNVYLNLLRLDEALAVAQQMNAKHMDTPGLHRMLYTIAFLRRDRAGMEQQMQWAKGKPGEDRWLANSGDTLAYFGRVAEAREISQRAAAWALRSGERDLASGIEIHAALRDVLFGYPKQARTELRSAQQHMLPLGGFGIALYFAFTGDVVRARLAADDLAKAFPEGTTVRFVYLPTIQAQIALDQGRSSEAIDLLQAAVPYDLAADADAPYANYVRGNAYLAAHRGQDAATQFQKLIPDARIGPVAYLKLGRAYAMAGDTAKARAAYQDLLELWKDADPDIPLLKQAKSELASLQ